MRAARFHSPAVGIEIEDVPRPTIGPGEVLVEVEGAGICHSDLHIIDGDLPIPNTPLVLGHENAGTVEAVGDAVDGVEEGTPVAVYGGWGCGSCRVCLRGDEQLCNVLEWVGIGRDGGYAEYLRVPDPRYLVELDGLEPVAAAPLTDAALTAYRAVRNAVAVTEPSDVIVVVGIGGLGGYGVQLADLLTGATVVAVDVDPAKLDRAARLGADVTVDASSQQLPREVRALTDGDGAGAVVDFVGSDETLQDGLNALRAEGALVLAGIGDGSVPFAWNPLNPAEVTLTTVQWGSRAELEEVIALAETGRLEQSVERITFSDLPTAFERLRAGSVDGRMVLTPNE